MALESKRLPALDGVRGLAILLVMWVHFTDRAGPTADSAEAIYLQLAGLGWIGVDLFFVLSGFLITSLLLESKGSPDYFRNFWARRVLRIFPAYYACLCFWFVVAPLIAAPESEYTRNGLTTLQSDQAWYWLYLSNWKMGLDGQWAPLGASVYWSLSIEEQFYLFWPVVVLYCSLKRLAYLCIAAIIAALSLRVGLVTAEANPILVFVSTPTRIDSLAAGALIGILARDVNAWVLARRTAPWIIAAATVSLAGIWIRIGSFAEYHPLMQTIGYSAIAFLFAGLVIELLCAPAHSRLSALFSNPVLRFFGRYSYAMYLFHLTIALVLLPRLGFELADGVGPQIMRFVICSAATIMPAVLSWNLFEKHFLAMKHYFPRAESTLMRL